MICKCGKELCGSNHSNRYRTAHHDDGSLLTVECEHGVKSPLTVVQIENFYSDQEQISAEQSVHAALFRADRLRDTALTLYAENERLRAALEPFAERGEFWIRYLETYPKVLNYPDDVDAVLDTRAFSLGDFKRAAKAMRKPEEEPK